MPEASDKIQERIDELKEKRQKLNALLSQRFPTPDKNASPQAKAENAALLKVFEELGKINYGSDNYKKSFDTANARLKKWLAQFQKTSFFGSTPLSDDKKLFFHYILKVYATLARAEADCQRILKHVGEQDLDQRMAKRNSIDQNTLESVRTDLEDYVPPEIHSIGDIIDRGTIPTRSHDMEELETRRAGYDAHVKDFLSKKGEPDIAALKQLMAEIQALNSKIEASKEPNPKDIEDLNAKVRALDQGLEELEDFLNGRDTLFQTLNEAQAFVSNAAATYRAKGDEAQDKANATLKDAEDKLTLQADLEKTNDALDTAMREIQRLMNHPELKPTVACQQLLDDSRLGYELSQVMRVNRLVLSHADDPLPSDARTQQLMGLLREASEDYEKRKSEIDAKMNLPRATLSNVQARQQKLEALRAECAALRKALKPIQVNALQAASKTLPKSTSSVTTSALFRARTQAPSLGKSKVEVAATAASSTRADKRENTLSAHEVKQMADWLAAKSSKSGSTTFSDAEKLYQLAGQLLQDKAGKANLDASAMRIFNQNKNEAAFKQFKQLQSSRQASQPQNPRLFKHLKEKASKTIGRVRKKGATRKVR